MFNLGTQKFFDSVHTICINKVYYNLYSSFDKDIKLLQKYFKNVKFINLYNIELPFGDEESPTDFKISKIAEILEQ